jgi:hypothetical protein
MYPIDLGYFNSITPRTAVQPFHKLPSHILLPIPSFSANMSIEECEAFDQLCLEGLALVSRYSQLLEPEAQAQPAAPTTSEADDDTKDDDSTSSSSTESIGSIATSFMPMQEYFNRPQTYDALLEKLEQLAPKINRKKLQEILCKIRIYLPDEDLLRLLKLLRCNCPRISQETSRCFLCSINICPVSSVPSFLLDWFAYVAVNNIVTVSKCFSLL